MQQRVSLTLGGVEALTIVRMMLMPLGFMVCCRSPIKLRFTAAEEEIDVPCSLADPSGA